MQTWQKSACIDTRIVVVLQHKRGKQKMKTVSNEAVKLRRLIDKLHYVYGIEFDYVRIKDGIITHAAREEFTEGRKVTAVLKELQDQLRGIK